jgi:type 1 glutamine amidotransferase
MSRVVVLAGGSPHAHDFGATGAELSALAAAAGHDVELIRAPDAVEAIDGAAALVFAGLWWRMEGAAYDTWRERYGYSPSPATQRALKDFVADGGGLLAVHTAPICFDDWPDWGDVVGGAWQWGVSSHPPPRPSVVRIVSDHPVVADIESPITITDEIYGDLSVSDTVDVLAVGTRYEGDADQPLVWAHRFGRGRVVYDALGHDVSSLRHPDHARLITRALAWVMERAA